MVQAMSALHFLFDRCGALPMSRSGDVWVHGRHRLWAPDMAGDRGVLLGPDGVVAVGRRGDLISRARAQAGARPERVLLVLHGLARTGRSMDRLAQAACRDGFHALRVCYPGFQPLAFSLARLVELAEALRDDGAATIDIIGHSQGGILGRALFGRLPQGLAAGRLVTLGSPHNGAALARLIRRRDLYPGRLDWLPPVAEMGAIVGTAMAGRGDGIVSVREATPDFGAVLHVPAFHSVLMARPDIIAASLHFIRYGRFPAIQEQSAP
jgi:pimeloyl-ACP methyl ester carboxylesterase